MTATTTKTLVLVRHCQATGQQPTAGLTEAGVRQSRRLADFLSDYPVDFIATSLYTRAHQSIEPFSRRVGLGIHRDGRFNERVLSGEPLANWEELVRRSFDDPDLHAAGGESARRVLCRANAALGDILQGHHALPLVVTHGNLVALLLHAVDDTFGYQGWKSLTNPDVYLMSRLPDGRRRFQRVWRGR